jgi:hypothetical protein
MSTTGLQALNQRYVRLTDRCRSQWTFYQFLQGAFKHLREARCPVEIDFPALFARFRALADDLAHPEPATVEHTLHDLEGQVDRLSVVLSEVDAQIPPSMLRRFFDRLRRQDEKVLLAIIKFYLDCRATNEDVIDKLDILFTRLAEIPREGGGSLARGRHELERIVAPLLALRPATGTSEREVEVLLDAIADLRADALGTHSFAELVGSGALDRFRAIKRRLGADLLHPRLLPAVLEATVAIKNRFRELWEDEEQEILNDTNRVMEARRALAAHPELATPELLDLFDTLSSAQRRVEEGRRGETIRREDVIELRRTLKAILEQFDLTQTIAPLPRPEPGNAESPSTDDPRGDESATSGSTPSEFLATGAAVHDPLLHEFISKIVFALELIGPDRTPAEVVQAKEVAALRMEPWEVEAIQRVIANTSTEDTIGGQRERLLMQATALRIRLDEEAREIDRLRKRRSDHLAELVDRATHSLQRAGELERRFQWFIDDALYRGATDDLEALFRSRMRLLRAYSGLWLIHNDSGGISPF